MPEKTIARIAAARGRRVWLVGGPVRDRLLGLEGGDLDLALDGAVKLIGTRAARELGGRFRWHPRFLTGRIVLADGHVDVARTRRERYATPAALPGVRPGTIEQDLARRDFTINAMALEVRTRGRGRLLDPFDGRADLEAGIVRILHDDSFKDDPTRAFRALRFATRLRFKLEAATRDLLRQMVEAQLHHRLSGQRVAAELRHAFREARAWPVLAAYVRFGLDSAWGQSTSAPEHRQSYQRLARLESGAASAHLGFALAFQHLPAPKREALAERLKLTRPEKRALVEGPPRAKRLARAIERTRGAAAIDALCHGADRSDLLLAAATAEATARTRIVHWWRNHRRVRLAIDGNDLRRAGIPAGPAIARGLAAARAALVSGRAPGREAQLRAALRA